MSSSWSSCLFASSSLLSLSLLPSLYYHASSIRFSTCRCMSIYSTILFRLFCASLVCMTYSRSSSESEYSVVNNFLSLAARFLRSFSFIRLDCYLSIWRVYCHVSLGFFLFSFFYSSSLSFSFIYSCPATAAIKSSTWVGLKLSCGICSFGVMSRFSISGIWGSSSPISVLDAFLSSSSSLFFLSSSSYYSKKS